MSDDGGSPPAEDGVSSEVPPGVEGNAEEVPSGEGEAAPEVPSPPSRRKLAAILVAVVVVAGGIGAYAFFATPSHDFGLTPPSSSTAPAVSFSQAYSEANASVQAAAGGPWLLVSATAIDSPTGFSYPPVSSVQPGCNLGSIPSAPPAGISAASAGLSPFWILTFEATSTNAGIGAVVQGGNVQVLGPTDPTAQCNVAYRYGTLLPAASILDSPAVVHSLTNFSAYAQAFPNSTTFFLLSDEGGAMGRVSNQAVWFVEASPCLHGDFGALSSSTFSTGDPEYFGGLNSSNLSQRIDANLPGFGRCEVPGSLGAHLNVSVDPRYTYAGAESAATLPILSASGGLTTAMFHPEVIPEFGPGGLHAPFAPSSLDFRVLDGSGATVAEYNFTSMTWTTGLGATVATGESFQLIVPNINNFQALILVADSPLTGELGFGID